MDDDAVKERIVAQLPNVPEQVIDTWLLPYAIQLGWPPDHPRWGGKLHFEPIEFWNEADWQKQTINLTTIKFSSTYGEQVGGLYRGYANNEVNDFTRGILDYRARIGRALQYTLVHGCFPVEPIIVQEKHGGLNILDGNHRFVAMICAKKISDDYDSMNEEGRQGYLTRLGVDRIIAPHDEQDVWMCVPDWSKSQNPNLPELIQQFFS